jgi:hypothetical protein
MNKYAIIHNGSVVNIIEYENQPSTPPAGFEDGHVAIKSDVPSIGWKYTNGTFINPNPPEVIEMPAPKSLTDMILESPTELAKLKQALGIA